MGTETVSILDVRKGRDWSSSEYKIKGAERIDNKNILTQTKKYSKNQTLVLYCAWPNESTSASLAQKLIAGGYKNVYALKGGWREWFRAKFPVEEK